MCPAQSIRRSRSATRRCHPAAGRGSMRLLVCPGTAIPSPVQARVHECRRPPGVLSGARCAHSPALTDARIRDGAPGAVRVARARGIADVGFVARGHGDIDRRGGRCRDRPLRVAINGARVGRLTEHLCASEHATRPLPRLPMSGVNSPHASTITTSPPGRRHIRVQPPVADVAHWPFSWHWRPMTPVQPGAQ